MGNWNINIQGIGQHHNSENPLDADLLATKFVAQLKDAGHTVEVANFTSGGKTDLLERVLDSTKAINIALMLLASVVCASAATTNAPPPSTSAPSLFEADTITVAGFRSVRVSDHESEHGRFGAGAEIGYALTKNWTVAGEFVTENPQHGDIDELGLNLKYYVPLKKSLAAYGLLGVTYSFDEETLAGDTTRDRQWRMNLGAGLEVRAAKHVGIFADGRWSHNFDDVGNGLFRLGLNIRF